MTRPLHARHARLFALVIAVCVTTLHFGVRPGPAAQISPSPSRVPLPAPLRPGTTVIELEFFFHVEVAWWYDPSTDTVRATFIGSHNMGADGKLLRLPGVGALDLIIPKAGDHHFLVSLAQSCAALAPAIKQPGFVMRFVLYGPPVAPLKPSEFTHQLTLTDPNITGFFCNNLT